MSGPRLHGAVIGVGHMGGHHARKLAARDDVRLSLVDPDKGHPGPLPDDLDFAVIAAPTAQHAALALPLLQRGVACLVEKPLAASLDDAIHLAAFPRLSVGHVERFNPAVTAIGDARPRFVECTRLSPWRAPRAGARGTDVDVVADLMVHDLDLARAWLGPGPVLDLRAVGVGVLSGAADIVDVRLEIGPSPGFPGGVAVLRASRVSPAAVRTARLFEDGRYWSLDLQQRQAHRVDWGGAAGADDLASQPVPVPAVDALEAEHQAFLAAVRGQAPFPVPGADAVAALTLVARIQRALRPAPAA
ncbi:Gfo/Idh/MocA family oxidoreductase [Myxococcota bacterium]|nr:Gfo/Idh/MocA family oxidoreductase [Myxococcota bacterium]